MMRDRDNRQNRRSRAAGGRGFSVLLAALVLFSVILPCLVLFTGSGPLADRFAYGRNPAMFAEIGVWVLLLAGIIFLGKCPGRQLLAFLFFALAVLWLHIVFLPAAVSALYLAGILLIGRMVRKIFRCTPEAGTAVREHAPSDTDAPEPVLSGTDAPEPVSSGTDAPELAAADFLIGSCFFVIVVCVMSLLHLGTIRKVQAAAAVLMGISGLWRLWEAAAGGTLRRTWRRIREALEMPVRTGRRRASSVSPAQEVSACAPRRGRADGRRRRALAGIAFCLVIFLIQAARMNRGQDYDSLWYGLRSAYILTVGGGIYDDPGMIGMVYVYSKGFEVLTLPLAGLSSYAYLFFFNLWLTVFGILMAVRLAARFMGRTAACFAGILCASVPAIVNMGITAKADTITWLVELMMADFFFAGLEASEAEAGGRRSAAPVALRRPANPDARRAGGRRQRFFYLMAIGAYLFSLTLKPTALVFSTALFGMMGLWLIFTRRLPLRALLSRMDMLALPLLALAGIWGRTWKLTGMPVMSVFTTIFEKLGFQTKYPFITTAVPANYREENPVLMLLRRLFGILLAPLGKDMAHVRIAWGTSLMFLAIVFLAVYFPARFALRGSAGNARRQAGTAGQSAGTSRRQAGTAGQSAGTSRRQPPRTDAKFSAAAAILLPFALVNLVSLALLYQVDGNYFLLFITAVILVFCGALDRLGGKIFRQARLTMIPLILLNVLFVTVTSWSGSDGFSRIHPANKGRINDRALVRERFTHYGCEAVYNTLASDRNNRVLAFAYHPHCLEIPCIIQSYKELYYPWGDDAITETPESLTRYMRYAKIRYVWAEATFMGNTQYPWGYGLFRDLIRNGTLKLEFLENGNALFSLTPEGEPVPAAEAEENLRKFDEVYARTDTTDWLEKTWVAVMENYEGEFR